MGRPKRMRERGTLYHVYSRGNRRQGIYLDSADYNHFQQRLWKTVERWKIGLYAWCLMPNHFHLLVETPEANLSQFMQSLLTGYARYANRKYQWVGHVFQGRFRSVYCSRKNYFLRLIRYISLNPIRTAGTPLTDALEDWEWSSHGHYLNLRKTPPFLQKDIAQALAKFSQDPSKAQAQYQRFIEIGKNDKEEENELNVFEKHVLGDEEFIRNVKAKCEEGNTKRPQPQPFAAPPIDRLELLAFHLHRHFGVSKKTLVEGPRSGALRRLRHAFVFIARNDFQVPNRILAKYLNRDESAISHLLEKGNGGSEVTAEISQLRNVLKKKYREPNHILSTSFSSPHV